MIESVLQQEIFFPKYFKPFLATRKYVVTRSNHPVRKKFFHANSAVDTARLKIIFGKI